MRLSIVGLMALGCAMAQDLPFPQRMPYVVEESYRSALDSYHRLFQAIRPQSSSLAVKPPDGRRLGQFEPGKLKMPGHLPDPPLILFRSEQGDCSIPLLSAGPKWPKISEYAIRKVPANPGLDRLPNRMPAPPCAARR